MSNTQRRAEGPAPTAAGGRHGDARLEAHGLTVEFGGLPAVDGVDVSLELGEVLGLIGPNGAGKSTLVNALTGFQRLTSGRVAIDGTDVTRWSPQKRARNGLVRTFQAARLFMSLSAYDNIRAAALAAGQGARQARHTTAEIVELFEFGARAELEAGTLTLGEERRLSIARALAARPRFLLLDEPAAGLNDAETAVLGRELAALRDRYELGLLVIEHDMGLIMSICQRIQVLNYGKTICVGSPEQVRTDQAVIEAYLGTHAEGGA